MISDNGMQFTGREFKNFCTSLSIDHITTTVYHPRSNRRAERFVDTLKKALRKNQGMDTDERSMQKFLAVYRIIPNLNRNSGLSPTELMFARKIRSVSDRLWPSPTKKKNCKKKLAIKFYKPGNSFLQKLQGWEKLLGRWNYH